LRHRVVFGQQVSGRLAPWGRFGAHKGPTDLAPKLRSLIP
jgi:hypothetical protein